MANIIAWVPLEVQKIGLVLLLTFLIGLVEEERKHSGQHHYLFGGVRTFPFFGMIGYACALIGVSYPAFLAVGLAGASGLMMLSYYHKSTINPSSGLTSETAGLLTFILGAVVYNEYYWIATTLVAASVLLLELKSLLEGLAERIPKEEVLTFTKFLVLTAVILPILPSEPMSAFDIKPQKIWLIVCAVSGISYASYVLQKFVGGKGIILSAILGGAYSSTATTIALAKSSASQNQPKLFSGAIVMASGVMYLRLALLIGILNSELLVKLSPILAIIGILVLLGGFLLSRGDPQEITASHETENRNPLEIRSALTFAALFVAMLIITPLLVNSLGDIGVYGLAVITGVTDVDPFILGLSETAGHSTTIITACIGIVIASAGNNLAKAAYAKMFSEKRTGRRAAFYLVGLWIVGLLPLIWFFL